MVRPETAYKQVQRRAEAIRNDEADAIGAIAPGDVVRQGDIYVIALDVAPKKRQAFPGRQLAPGTSQGSRHVVVGECDLYEPDQQFAASILARLVPTTRSHRQFFGPTIMARESITIEHPEHGDRQFPPGIYQVTYQRTFAEEIRRTQD